MELEDGNATRPRKSRAAARASALKTKEIVGANVLGGERGRGDSEGSEDDYFEKRDQSDQLSEEEELFDTNIEMDLN